jgi:peptide/nickel transport system permease protein
VTRYALRRIALGVATLFIVSVIVFTLSQLVGDPAQAVLGRDAQIPSLLHAKRAQLGLDRSAVSQYLDWLGSLVRGDPGNSFTTGQPLGPLVAARLVNSLFLVLIAAVVAVPVALLTGAWAAWRHNGLVDTVATSGSLVLAAIPEFVVGTTLVVVFATSVFDVLPAVSSVRGETRPWDDLRGMVLPAITLALAAIPYIFRAVRQSMTDVLGREYIESARLRGVSSPRLMWRHVTPNATAATLNVVALSLAYMVTGVVVVEEVFNYPGIGSALVDAISAHNVPMVQCIAMICAAVFVVANVAADLGAAMLTPRLRTTMR